MFAASKRITLDHWANKMHRIESRAVLDDFDPYIDEAERVELGESRVLVKDELYMPVHPSRDWIKCFVTSTQQDGFR